MYFLRDDFGTDFIVATSDHQKNVENNPDGVGIGWLSYDLYVRLR